MLYIKEQRLRATVQAELTAMFRRYERLEGMLIDNGSPWGSPAERRYTRLEVWLLEPGVSVRHGRPYHPQTPGKDERFHFTLMPRRSAGAVFADLAACQRRFDAWRVAYNTPGRHQALELAAPATRYRPSRHAFPEKPAAFDCRLEQVSIALSAPWCKGRGYGGLP